MRPNAALPGKGAALLLALVAALLLLRQGAVPLVGPDEPRYARVAIEMSRSGNLVTPTLQGTPWLEKPALYYWMAAAAFRALGETETAARLPSFLAALALVAATALTGARLFGGAAGLHAGFVAGTSLLAFAYGRAASMDMLLAACVTAAIGLVALSALGIAGPLAIPAAWAFAGLATLAKGPLGLLLPALVVGTFAAVTRDGRLVRRLLSPLGIVAFLVVAGPWYALILLDQGRAFVDTFLLGHNVERFTSTVHRHPGPVVYYLPVLLAGLFPWSALVPVALASVRPRRSHAELFALLWLAVPLVFFSLAGSKLPGYILPCLPPLALLAGRAADDLAQGRLRAPVSLRAGALVNVILAALLAAAPLVLRQRGDPAWPLLLPLGAWSLATALLYSRAVGRDPSGALRLLRVAAAGILALVTMAAPPILARRESGRELFLPARGREVLAWGAWRTAWMAGYFYNDARVREVDALSAIDRAAATGPALVVCGSGERRILEGAPGLRSRVLARGPRENVLMSVERHQP